MQVDRERWDQRYQGRSPAVPLPPDVLGGDDELLAALPVDGIAVDIACGAGAQSLWLAGRGQHVVALDVSPVAIGLTRTAAAAHELTDHIDARVVDLDDGLPGDLHDVTVVVCQRFRNPALYGPIVDVLGPGGIAVVSVLSVVGLNSEPGEFHAPEGELRIAFDRADTDVVRHTEAAGVASIVVQRR